uniref:Secreted protein n=1 Tax=Steinernema glaseri TaxID=37863 RepID=A0A1I7YHH1_9BILA
MSLHFSQLSAPYVVVVSVIALDACEKCRSDPISLRENASYLQCDPENVFEELFSCSVSNLSRMMESIVLSILPHLNEAQLVRFNYKAAPGALTQRASDSGMFLVTR